MSGASPRVMLVLAIILGWAFSRCFEYRRIDGTEGRPKRIPAQCSLAVDIDAIHVRKGSGVRELALLTAQFVARRLRYSYQGSPGVDMNDPISIHRHRAVNCQGYSTLYAVVLTRLIRQAGLADKYAVRTTTGHIFFLGRLVQFRRYFTSHVYNVVYQLDGERAIFKFAADANLYDYTGILFVSERNAGQESR